MPPGLSKPRKPGSIAPGLQRRLVQRRLRVCPWQGNPRVVLVAPSSAQRRPTVGDILACVRSLMEMGVEATITPALGLFEAEPFFQAGFQLHERLHLLSKDLVSYQPQPLGETLTEAHARAARSHPLRDADLTARISIAKAGRRHRQAMLNVDEAAFHGFWKFDHRSLSDALNATPHNYARLARHGSTNLGYAITGLSGDRGYLQRLAVVPEAQGLGLGAALVHDSSTWLRSRGARSAMVNTQEQNTRALELYERAGFIRQRDGLVVLRWDRGS